MFSNRSAILLAAALLAFPLAQTVDGAQKVTPKKSGAGTTKKSAIPSKPAEPKKKSAEEVGQKKSEEKTPPKKETEPEEKRGEAEAQPVAKVRAPSATLETSDLVEFSTLPPRKQRLIEASLALTKLNLTYTYGSADPSLGGMDCSGTMYYTLRAQGFKEVPRDSPGQYVWVRKARGFQAVNSRNADSFEFEDLKPGDLLFWSGTYAVDREFPITHVMLYLGREKKSGARVMFGASDGRSYKGIQRWGVSVFDFKMPRAADPAKSINPTFLGYGPIPGIDREDSPIATSQPPPEEKAVEATEPEPKPAPKTTKTTKPATKAPAKSPTKKPATRKK